MSEHTLCRPLKRFSTSHTYQTPVGSNPNLNFPVTLGFTHRGANLGPRGKLLAEPDMSSPATSSVRTMAIAFLNGLFLTMVSACAVAQTTPSEIQKVIASAFAATHDGWSVDEMILRRDLNGAFLKKCHDQLPEVAPAELNWRCLLYTSPSPRDQRGSRMPSSA